jgi:tetratricopeptide (TPR) repeat protein
MTRIRNAAAGIALGSALLVTNAHAARPEPAQPPAEWAQYIAEVRKADAMEDGEARCKAYPDLPGNEWRPGAAQARCTLLRPAPWPLEEIGRLLSTSDGVDALERGFSALLDAHYKDQSQREQIFIAFSVFNESPQSGAISQRWLELAPNSAFANTAAGIHYGASGWEARGGEYAAKTPAEKFKRMEGLFAKAVPLYGRALEIEPRLSVACHRLIGIGMQSSDALQNHALSHCTKVDPDSYYVTYEQFLAAQPKWGGSDEQMRWAVAYASARVERNPILGALLGEAAGYYPSMADDYDTVVDELTGATRMAPSGTLMGHAGNGYWGLEQPWPAMVYLSQATRFWPRDARLRYERAAVLFDWLEDPEWARSDLRIAIEEAPDNSRYLYLLGKVTEDLDGPLAARPYFKRAMSGKRRQQAMERYCQTYMIPGAQLSDADNCTRELVIEFPLSGEGWRLRAWTLYEAGSLEVLDAVEQFARTAKPDSRLHQDDLKHMQTVWKAELEALAPSAGAVPSANSPSKAQ